MVPTRKIKIKEIFSYFSALLAKLFSLGGGSSTLASICLFFFGNQIFPSTVPSFFLGILLFLLTLIGCGAAVWFDQQTLTESTQKKLDDLKSTIPKFSLDKVGVVKYSIKPIIQHYEQILAELDKAQNSELIVLDLAENSTSTISSPFTSPDVSSAISAIKKMSEAFTSQIKPLSLYDSFSETPEEKYKRIKEHVVQLKRYEQNLKSIYEIDLSFISSRSANNIEVTLSTAESSSIVLDDDFINKNIPTTSEPSRRSGLILPSTVHYDMHRFTSQSRIKSGKAIAGVTKFVNALSPEIIFDQSLFVITDADKLTLEIDIISKELLKPQSLKHEVSLNEIRTLLVRG